MQNPKPTTPPLMLETKCNNTCFIRNLEGWLVLLQELLRLVDFGGQVRASSSIGVVEQHELPVVLPYLLLGQSPLAVPGISYFHPPTADDAGCSTLAAISAQLPSGSSWAQSLLCNKPFPVPRRRPHRLDTCGTQPDLRDPIFYQCQIYPPLEVG